MTTGEVLGQHSSTMERLKEAFNWQLMEGTIWWEGVAPGSRARPLSYLALVLNIILRNWLFQFILPHPSLSLTWMVALALSPFFLFRLMTNLTHDKNVALMTTILYLSLPGTLIPVMMYFHPGKVFSNFFFIFCLYLASRIQKKTDSGDFRTFKWDFLFLVATVCLSLLFDEYSLFIFFLIPLFFPKIFIKHSKSFAILSFLTIPVFYYVCLIFLLPWIYNLFGFPGFDFFNFVDIQKHVPTFSFSNAVLNFILLLHDNLNAGFNLYLKDKNISVLITQYASVANRLIHADNIRIGLTLLNDRTITWSHVVHHILSLSAIILLLTSFRKSKGSTVSQDPNHYFFKSNVALLLFTLFFTLLHITNYILSGCAWYGCSFSVLFAITMGFVFQRISRVFPWSRLIAFLFFFSLIINSLWHTRLLNTAWLMVNRNPKIQLDVWLNKFSPLDLYRTYHSLKKESNLSLTYKAWISRDDPETAKNILSDAPDEVRNYLKAEFLLEY